MTKMGVPEEPVSNQIEEILRELTEIAKVDPASGTYLLVGQNGYLERNGSDRRKPTFIGSGR